MDEKQQKNQLPLAFMIDEEVKPELSVSKGAETSIAKRTPQSPTSTERLMEEVCERENLKKALKRVKANKGNPGIDRMGIL
jgi:RNA-directed DNA polymerase